MRWILFVFLSMSGALGPSVSGSSLPANDAEAITASLRKTFGDSIEVRQQVVRLPKTLKDSVAAESRSSWGGDSIIVYICKRNGQTVGYGVADDVKGKTQFISYLVATTRDGSVENIDVLHYRESYGGEISYESFRKQFRNKSASDKLQPGNDIKNISGATISVRAITFGVKKILLTLDRIHPLLSE